MAELHLPGHHLKWAHIGVLPLASYQRLLWKFSWKGHRDFECHLPFSQGSPSIPRLLAYNWIQSALSAAMQSLSTSLPHKDLGIKQRPVPFHPGPPTPLLLLSQGCRACPIHGYMLREPETSTPCQAVTAPGFAPHSQHHGSPWSITALSCLICPRLTTPQSRGERPAAQGSALFPGGHAAFALGWECSAAQWPVEDDTQGCGELGMGSPFPRADQQSLTLEGTHKE